MQDEEPTPPRRADVAATIDGNELRLLATGAERTEAILALIDGAKQDLRILFYLFANDESGIRVRDALAAAAGRGIEVRLILDGFGSFDAPEEFFQPIADAGGSFHIFHPRFGRRYFIRNHQKLVVADGRTALIGGANISDHYLDDENPDRWRDLWLQIEGSTVSHAARYFDALDQWVRAAKPTARALRRLIATSSEVDGPIQWRFSGPLPRGNPWPSSIARELIHGQRLDLVAAYFAPAAPMLWRIGRLVQRGGKARIVTAAKSDNNATIAAARHLYSRLLRRGVEMYEYRACRMHTKLVIIDDAVHIGSSNFDFRSLYLNVELMLRIEDQGFADQMRGFVDGEIADSIHVTTALHRKRANLWRRFKWAVSHWLVTSMDYTVTRRLNFPQTRD